ncbi:Pimeloyl-ACP methyl ester carboxylesterase [Amycolatopsis arida]|uniref:Pimeloyl-ACP methyl ester carboxylesterase n=1 Tax=Amycolatopsis arida TaxID=587909 RepID=A0A1I5L8M2_9PSEU|nr:alpha/beta hydrolase [Amycolatopsis arida]TDX93625.1 pimeloyl-ACP methyl ester carboxylesterase [Amycolatopsis arida]SFO93568.1 Pimeloyl-ACP methyl ester carboxylesterase [Amycolatopsis arida]
MTDRFAHVVLGNGPGLLLAHGAGGSIADNFRPVLGDLAATHTVVGADYPGSGETPRDTEPLTLDGLADGLVAVADDAGLDRFTVLGYSMGTAVAVRLTTRHPDRVNGLVLTSGLARPDHRVSLLADVWRGLLDGDRTTLAKFLIAVAVGSAYLDSLDREGLDDLAEFIGDLVPEGTADHLDLLATVDTRAELPRVGVPTLVVATTDDLLTPPHLSRELAAGIPGAELMEIAAGHSVTMERTREWLATVRPFLARLSP